MADNERITVRLPTDKLALLQSLVGTEDYDNLSDIVRQAVE